MPLFTDPVRTDPPLPFKGEPWSATPLSEVVTAVPTMLSEEEGQLLVWLSKIYAEGVGTICDLGCFAGGSTARLAEGVRAAGRTTRVHAFDHFTLNEAQKVRYLYPAGIDPFDGEDMLPAVRQLLTPWQKFVEFHKGDLTRFPWVGGPIELLFVDAAKTPVAADRIAEMFFPHLIPGRSIIIQQDYQHWRQPWVPAQMELMHGAVTPVGWCRRGSVIFRVEAPITPDVLAKGRVNGLSDAELTDLLQRALYRFPKRPQRADMGRAILGLADNPGARRPQRMDNSAFSQERIKIAIQEAETRFATVG